MTDGVDPYPRLAQARGAAESVGQQLQRNAQTLRDDLIRREVERKTRTGIDVLEEKTMRDTATLAAASGTPEQAKAMLRRARGKLMTAAANGADTKTLEIMVREFERLAKVAEERRSAGESRRSPAAPQAGA